MMLASQIDAAILLLPLIGVDEARRMLTNAGVSLAVIERVLERPEQRRAIQEPASQASPCDG